MRSFTFPRGATWTFLVEKSSFIANFMLIYSLEQDYKMNSDTVQDFLIARAAKLSGLTPAMLNYLCREKVLLPSVPGRRGRGRPRRYSFGDVVMLRVIAKLLKAGVSVMIADAGKTPHCLKMTTKAQPSHPLYLSAHLRPIPMKL